jgi:hypothetical protein
MQGNSHLSIEFTMFGGKSFDRGNTNTILNEKSNRLVRPSREQPRLFGVELHIKNTKTALQSAMSLENLKHKKLQ